jgi:hypothetical protein
MIYVMVMFPDGTNISAMAPGANGKINNTPGTVFTTMNGLNPPEPVLVHHVHSVPEQNLKNGTGVIIFNQEMTGEPVQE